MTLVDKLRAFPPGTLAVATSVGIAGLASYGFMVVAARALGPDAYAPLSVMWVLTILIGPGLFLPVEQELARALSIRSAQGIGASKVVRRAATLAMALLLLVIVALVGGHTLLTQELFHDRAHIVEALGLALVGYSVAHLTKGVLAGAGKFRSYAKFTAVEAMARLGLVVAVAAIGSQSPAPYAFAVGVATFLGVGASLWGTGGLVEAGPPGTWRELTTSLASLLAASLLALALANVGPVAVQLLSEDSDSDAIASFLLALVVARVPLFLFQAMQAGLVPRIAILASGGQFARLRHELRNMLLVVAAIGLSGVTVAAVAGPTLVRLLFGAEYSVGARTMTLLALASSLFMVASVVAQAGIAMGGQAGTAWAWATGLTVFVGALFLPLEEIFVRVELASVLSCLVACAAQGYCVEDRLRRSERAPRTPSEAVS